MPLLRDAVSYTLSGNAAVNRPRRRGDGGEDRRAVAVPLSLDLEPRAGRSRGFVPSVAPLGPKQTQLTTKWLVHKDAVEGEDYSIDELTKVWTATNNQDRKIVEENQIGVSSPVFEPGPYAPTHEGGLMPPGTGTPRSSSARSAATRSSSRSVA